MKKTEKGFFGAKELAKQALKEIDFTSLDEIKNKLPVFLKEKVNNPKFYTYLASELNKAGLEEGKKVAFAVFGKKLG